MWQNENEFWIRQKWHFNSIQQYLNPNPGLFLLKNTHDQNKKWEIRANHRFNTKTHHTRSQFFCKSYWPAIGLAILFVKVLISKLPTTLRTEEVFWMPHLLQGCDAFLEMRESYLIYIWILHYVSHCSSHFVYWSLELPQHHSEICPQQNHEN